jgi:hypothetical protein
MVVSLRGRERGIRGTSAVGNNVPEITSLCVREICEVESRVELVSNKWNHQFKTHIYSQ